MNTSNTNENVYNNTIKLQKTSIVKLPKKSDTLPDRQKYQSKLIQKIAKSAYETMIRFQQSSKKLENSQDVTAKKLGVQLQIKDEELYKFINKEMTLEELQDIIKYLLLKTKKLSYILKCILYIDLVEPELYSSFLKILGNLYKIFRKFFAFLEFDKSILIDNEQKAEYSNFKNGVLFTISSLFKKIGKSDNKNLQKLQTKFGVSQADQKHLIELREQASKNSFNQFDDLVKDFQIDYNLMRNEVQNKIRKFETSINIQQVDYKSAIKKIYQAKNDNEQIEEDHNVEDQDNFEDKLFDDENQQSNRKQSQQSSQNNQIVLNLTPQNKQQSFEKNEMFQQFSDDETDIEQIKEQIKKFNFKEFNFQKNVKNTKNLQEIEDKKNKSQFVKFDFDLVEQIKSQNIKGNLHVLIYSMNSSNNFSLTRKKLKRKLSQQNLLQYLDPKPVSNLQIPFKYCFIIRFKLQVPKQKNQTNVLFHLSDKYNENTKYFLKNFQSFSRYFTEENYLSLTPKMTNKMKKEFYFKYKDMQKLRFLENCDLKNNIFIKRQYINQNGQEYLKLFLKFVVENLEEFELKINDLKII